MDQFLVHCKISNALWSIIFSVVRFRWVVPHRVVDLFACSIGFFGRSWSSIIWKIVPSCLMWCIWRDRNDWSFEDSEWMVKELKDFFFKTITGQLPWT
jgi:hypothetical protein